jgi:tRNA(Ile)-lysidine synthase
MHFAPDVDGAMVPHICPPLADVGSAKVDAPGTAPSIVRPLLEIRRTDIEHYLRDLDQPWCTDASNADLKHTRNRVRHELLPHLERDFNPALRDRLSELAEIARAEEDYWQQQVRSEVQRLTAAATPPGPVGSPESARYDEQFSLHLDLLAQLPLAMQRRVIREAAKSVGLTLDFSEVEEVLSLAAERAAKTVQLHDRWFVSINKLYVMRVSSDPEGLTGLPRSGRTLLFHRSIQQHSSTDGYAYGLCTPGEIKIPELRTLLRARLVPLAPTRADRVKQRETPASEPEPSYTRSQLLNPQLLTSELLVRNWRPGDRFWPAHTSSPKKVKELLQQKHITSPLRETWPVVVSGDEIVWMRGFPVSERYRAPEGSEAALVIDEVAIGG